jgi:hypothetical protein
MRPNELMRYVPAAYRHTMYTMYTMYFRFSGLCYSQAHYESNSSHDNLCTHLSLDTASLALRVCLARLFQPPRSMRPPCRNCRKGFQWS